VSHRVTVTLRATHPQGYVCGCFVHTCSACPHFRHNISCQANQVLQRWRLTRPTATTIAFEFFCAPATLTASTCEQLTTPWNANGGGELRNLDKWVM
jgi:hypothetical protein